MNNPAPSEIVTAFHRLHANVMARVFPHMARILKGQEISFLHFVAMFKIRVAGSQSVASIAKEVELTHAAASRMVDRLVKGGYVDRVENPADRRQKLISLTPKGSALLEELPAATLDGYADILAKLPDELIAQLCEPMRNLYAALPPRPRRPASPQPTVTRNDAADKG
ncbi:MarR family transcriptional regulator [Jiella sp. MQZ9-1]|uniref:MarR family transcriptional regulator n=1 Tax=Jiella flava TaxID=2816857 RepID=A0A939FUZ8_9HYPH|nr:MarR family transcriptional regulator [Jiella flava]MBO0661935.1 MarR family transcriptional regulator [Jiella flava]MCD2470737.1 MarR family transcriptional regulator [Jiella flava]